MIDRNVFLLTSTQQNLQKMHDEIYFYPTSSVKDSWISILVLVWLPFAMISFIANGFFMGLWIILSVLIASLSAYMVISQTDEYRRYQFSTVVQKYKKEKIDLLRIYSSVVSDMNVDFSNQKISPEKIIDIEHWIRNLTWCISNIYAIYKKMLILKGNLHVFSDQAIRANSLDFLTQEWLWLTECIASFSRDLDTWMACHHSELVQLWGSVDAQARTTDIAEWKAALGITEERISRLSEEIPIRVKS